MERHGNDSASGGGGVVACMDGVVACMEVVGWSEFRQQFTIIRTSVLAEDVFVYWNLCLYEYACTAGCCFPSCSDSSICVFLLLTECIGFWNLLSLHPDSNRGYSLTEYLRWSETSPHVVLSRVLFDCHTVCSYFASARLVVTL